MKRKNHITSTRYHLHSSPHFLYVEQLNLSFFFCWRMGTYVSVFLIAGEPSEWLGTFFNIKSNLLTFMAVDGMQKKAHTSWNAQRSDTFRLVNDGKMM